MPLHPITKCSQINMFKMQKNMAKLQPKLEVVKAKYANDRVALNQAMMQIYKEEGVNPAGGMLSCLPMMLQIPSGVLCCGRLCLPPSDCAMLPLTAGGSRTWPGLMVLIAFSQCTISR